VASGVASPLAALLVEDWDLVILDEPTNHLDVEGVQWLADHLKQRWTRTQGGLLVVTHDRWFLDEVCTATWEVHDRVVEPFDGGYARVRAAAGRARPPGGNRGGQAPETSCARSWPGCAGDRQHGRASPSSRIDAANMLIDDIPPARDRVELAKLATARLGKDVVDIENVSVSYGENVVPHRRHLADRARRPAGVLGANGAGKSTLLGLVSGSVKRPSGA